MPLIKAGKILESGLSTSQLRRLGFIYPTSRVRRHFATLQRQPPLATRSGPRSQHPRSHPNLPANASTLTLGCISASWVNVDPYRQPRLLRTDL